MLATPLQERMDDWKKVAVQFDKEHSKGNTWDFLKIQSLALVLTTKETRKPQNKQTN